LRVVDFQHAARKFERTPVEPPAGHRLRKAPAGDRSDPRISRKAIEKPTL
jgi:hypothetical protein